jgi:hypothetical protein
MEAHAELAFQLSLPYFAIFRRRSGLILPIGLARPQPGLMEIENLIHYPA